MSDEKKDKPEKENPPPKPAPRPTEEKDLNSERTGPKPKN